MRKYLFLLGFIIMLGNSCVKIPAEAITLSDVVGQRIAAIQTAHENLISQYFKNSRSEVDRFMQDKWIPTFLETFVEPAEKLIIENQVTELPENLQNKIKDELDKTGTYTELQLENIYKAVNNGLSHPEPSTIISKIAIHAIEKINQQRTSMMDIVDHQEALVLKEIRANYNELILLQSTLTAHIKSAHKVVTSQDEILNKLGVLDKRDKILEDAINTNELLNALLKEEGSALDLGKNFIGSL